MPTNSAKNANKMEKRKQIYEGLKKHYGAIVRLAKEQGVSREWVRMVLNGERDDEKLLVAASKLWLDLETERVNLLSQAASFADQAAAIAMT